jgi:hypothetical protein
MLTTRRFAGLLTTLLMIAAIAACSDGAVSIAPTTGPSAAAPLDPDAPVSTEVPPGGAGTGIDPGGQFVDPKPGQLDPHPVAISLLTANVDGRHVVVTASWTSGVEPCYVLDTIVVDKGDHAFTITLREGHGADDVVCIEIAMQKATRIDLGELEPGTYTISDGQGTAPPIEVVVS